MATLKDLARHVNLSVTQVSRALNDHADVSRATKARVREGAREIGYRPNLTARKLKSGRSDIVAMIVPGRSETVEIELLMESVMGLSAEFSRRGLQFVLHVLSDVEDAAEAHARLVRGGSIDGIVVTDPVIDDPRIAVLTEAGTPFVVHGRDRPDAAYPFVDIDHRAVGAALARALVARGCRRIALVDGPADRPYAARRREGAAEVLEAAGLRLDPGRIRPGPMIAARGQAEGAGLDADGVIAGNMMLATGLRAAMGPVPLAAHDDGIRQHAPETVGPPLVRTLAPLAEAWVPLCDGLSAAIAGRASQVILDHRLHEEG